MADTAALLTYLAQGLVDLPEEVRVEPADDGRRTVLELRVAPGDLGKVIGRQGRTARALRTVISAAAARRRERVSVDILD